MPGQLLLDPWSPDYEAPASFDGQSSAPPAFGGKVDVCVETAQWAAVRPADGGWAPERVYFVDGVRRVEARVLAEQDSGEIVHGLLASVAAGAVLCVPGERSARYERLASARHLLLTAGQALALEAGPGIRFDGASVAGSTPDDLMNALQQMMRTLEAELAAQLFAPDACVFADGPLSYLALSTHRVTGLIKRIVLTYVDAEHLKLVSRLNAGERTPVFLIQDGKYDRYSWFQRLAPSRAGEHGFAGIVRLEVRASLGLDVAREIADFAARSLCLYASSPVRDPRAPQNLVPVGALESELRRRLGDAVLIRRSIERAIAQGVFLS